MVGRLGVSLPVPPLARHPTERSPSRVPPPQFAEQVQAPSHVVLMSNVIPQDTSGHFYDRIESPRRVRLRRVVFTSRPNLSKPSYFCSRTETGSTTITLIRLIWLTKQRPLEVRKTDIWYVCGDSTPTVSVSGHGYGNQQDYFYLPNKR